MNGLIYRARQVRMSGLQRYTFLCQSGMTSADMHASEIDYFVGGDTLFHQLP